MKYMTYNGKRVLNNGSNIIKNPIYIPIFNSGAAGTTDWINPTDGFAEGWYSRFGGIGSIVTGNGFVGNAQRVVDGMVRQDNISGLIIGRKYKLSFKYRSSRLGGDPIQIRQPGGGLMYGFASELAIGDAILFEQEFIPTYTTISLQIGWFIGIDDYMEIDEVMLIEE